LSLANILARTSLAIDFTVDVSLDGNMWHISTYAGLVTDCFSLQCTATLQFTEDDAGVHDLLQIQTAEKKLIEMNMSVPGKKVHHTFVPNFAKY